MDKQGPAVTEVASNMRKRAIVLDDSDDEYSPPTPSESKESAKRPRVTKEATTPTRAAPAQAEFEAEVTPQAAAEVTQTPRLPTPDPTPNNKQRELYEVPEIAERYVPKVSTLDQVEYTNPQVFCKKPRFWKKWSPGNYIKFAEYLREQFDPVPFAQFSRRPVEEVCAVFEAVVVGPLYFRKEALQRGEDGMNEVFERHEKGGVPTRPWGRKEEKEGKEVPIAMAELSGIAPGSVQLTTAKGNKMVLTIAEMSAADKKYLKDTLAVEDRQILLKGQH